MPIKKYPYSKKENCRKNGGSEERAGDYGTEEILRMLQHYIYVNGNVRTIFSEKINDVRGIIVGYIPGKACFWEINIKNSDNPQFNINFYGQFSSVFLSRNHPGDEPYDNLPGNNKGGGKYSNGYSPVKGDRGYFLRSHCIARKNYMLQEKHLLTSQWGDLIARIGKFLYEFVNKVHSQLAPQFRCQRINAMFLVSCKSNDLSKAYCNEKNAEIAGKFPAGMFSERTAFVPFYEN